MRTTASTLISALVLAPALAGAECNLDGEGEVNIISNSFPSLEVIAAEVESCSTDTLTVTHKLTREHKPETQQAFAAGTSPYELGHVTNATIAPLQADGLLMPLNEYVEQYRDQYNLEDGMLIRFGEDVMAVAFMVNAQHLFYRKDLLEKHGIEVPSTYDEVLAAAEVLAADESIEHPLGGTYKAGWNLAQEFVNAFLAYGGQFFKEGTAEPAFNSEAGLKALELMKKLMGYMSPNALALDTTSVMQQFQQGQIAMANLWASRAEKMDDAEESKVVDRVAFAAAPAVVEGGAPATTLWWDGFSMPKNMDGNPDLAFQVLMEGLKEEVVTANNDAAIWLRSAYTPGRYAEGAAASAGAGAPSYPMLPQISLAHGALGDNIGDFLAGSESAEKSLADAEAAYIQAAKEAGYLD